MGTRLSRQGLLKQVELHTGLCSDKGPARTVTQLVCLVKARREFAVLSVALSRFSACSGGYTYGLVGKVGVLGISLLRDGFKKVPGPDWLWEGIQK